jgi:hypothetical protein
MQLAHYFNAFIFLHQRMDAIRHLLINLGILEAVIAFLEAIDIGIVMVFALCKTL